MRFGLLGPTEVEDDLRGGQVPVGGAVPRRVLTALLVRCGRVVPVDSLVLAVWGDDAPFTAERSLQSHVTRLRDALGRDGSGVRLTFAGGGYRLDVDPDALDTTRFVSAVSSARATAEGDPATAAALIEEALALWRGQPYADLAGTDYPSAEAARLEELRLAARLDHAEFRLAAGQAALAGSALEALVAEDPFHERAWELLVVALYRQGRQADALAAYRRARTALHEELGVEPGARLREIEQQVLDQDAALLGRLPAGPVAKTPCPYKGLTRYDVTDARLFVGRERLVEELVATLVDRRLVVLVGPSGTGKSSVVRAGLLPRLAEGAIPGSEHWVTRVVVPDDQPLARMGEALADHPDLLIVDQAEGAWSDQVAATERDAVADLVSNPGAGTRVVLALRADFYGRLTEHTTLARLAGPATVLVGPPSQDDLRRIVTEPARLVGLTVDPAVADEIVRQTSGHEGVLPLVSTALVRLWEHREGDRLTLAGYRGSGGVQAALERAGEDAWSALVDDDERAAARRILVRLARYEDNRWVSRRLPRAEVAPGSDVAARSAVEVLCDHRLAVVHAESLEVAHEALFTGWPRLAGWLADAASSRRELERLASAAGDWAAEGRDEAQLLRGARLVAAADVVEAHPEDVATLEHEFVAASSAVADREAASERERTRAALRSRRRTRIFATALAVALLVSLSAGVVAVRQARNANDAALAADAGRIGALARDPTVPEDQALLLGAQADSMHPGPVEDSDLLAALARSPALDAAARSPSRVLSMSVSPDGGRVVTAGVQGQIVSWDPRTLRQLSSWSGKHAGMVGAVTGGRTIVGTQGLDPSVEVLGPDGQRLADIPVPDNVNAPQVAVDGQWMALVSGATDRTDTVALRRIDAPMTEVASTVVPGHVVDLFSCGPLRFCLFTQRGALHLLSIPDASLSRAVDTVSGLAPGQELAGPPVGVAASPGGDEVALGASANGLIQVRALPSGQLMRTFAVPPFEGSSRSFSPDGRLLAAYSSGQVQVWDVRTGDLIRSFAGHVGAVISAAWSPDSRVLYTAGLDRQVLAWDVADDLAGSRSFTRSVSLDDPAEVGTAWVTANTVVAGLSDGHLLFVRRVDGTVIRPTQAAGTDWVDTARSGGRGTLLVAADLDGTLTVWDSATGTFRGRVDLPPAQMDPGAWVASDGVTAATMRSPNGPLYLIDLPTQKVRTVTLHLPAGAVPYAVYGWTRDARVIVAVGSPEVEVTAALLVDPRTGQVVRRIAVPGDPGEMAADPAGSWLAAAGLDGYLRFISLADGHLLAPPQVAVDGIVYNVSVSPDGRYVATGGAPGQVRLWDTSTFREVGPDLPTPIDAGTARVRFAPDGSLVAVFSPFEGVPTTIAPFGQASGADLRHGAVVWTYPIGRSAWTAEACRVVGRSLTHEEWNTFLPELAYQPSCH